jgi:hypothetical protein
MGFMSDSVRVNPDDLHAAAGSMRERAADLIVDGPPDVGAGDWPSQQAVGDFHRSVDDTNGRHHRRQRDLADSVTGAANSYAVADGGSGVGAQAALKPQDSAMMVTGVTKDILGTLGSAGQAVAAGVGALGSAAVSGLGVAANAAAQVGAVMVTTGAKLAEHDDAAAANPGGGIIAGAGAGGAGNREVSRSSAVGTDGSAAAKSTGNAGSPRFGDYSHLGAHLGAHPGAHPDQPDTQVQPAEARLSDSAGGHHVTRVASQGDSSVGPMLAMPAGLAAARREKTHTATFVSVKLFDDEIGNEHEDMGDNNEKHEFPIAFASPPREEPDERHKS